MFILAMLYMLRWRHCSAKTWSPYCRCGSAQTDRNRKLILFESMATRPLSTYFYFSFTKRRSCRRKELMSLGISLLQRLPVPTGIRPVSSNRESGCKASMAPVMQRISCGTGAWISTSRCACCCNPHVVATTTSNRPCCSGRHRLQAGSGAHACIFSAARSTISSTWMFVLSSTTCGALPAR